MMSPLMRTLVVVLFCCFVVGSRSQTTVQPGALEDALRTVAAGGTLVLLPGIHTLSNNVTLTRSSPIYVTITTEQKGQALISCTNGNSGIIIENATVTISNIIFSNCNQALTFMSPPNSIVDNCEFINNTAGIYSFMPMQIRDTIFHHNFRAAFLIGNRATGNFTLTRINAYNNSNNDIGIFQVLVANVTVTDSTFSNNSVLHWGGVFYGNGPSVVTIRNSSFVSNCAFYGAAIFFTALHAIIDNCTFSNNLAGTAIIYTANADMKLFIYSTTFVNNRVTGGSIDSRSAGPVSVTYGGSAVIEDSTFYNNAGACISATDGSNVTLNRISIDRNQVTAFFLSKGTATISSCNFTNNWDTYSGGALQVTNSTLAITDSNFYNNSAYSEGGAVYVKNSVTTGQRLTFRENYVWNSAAIEGGGAFMMTDGTATFSQITFERNGLNSYPRGGAIKANSTSGCSLTVSDSVFTNNHGGGGGAAFIQQCFVLLQNNTFSMNSGVQGGAIYASVDANMTIKDCIVRDNTAVRNGGGIYFPNVNHSVHVLNSKFVNNSADGGGALYQAGGKTVVENTEILNNTATLFSNSLGGGGARVQGFMRFLNVTFEYNDAYCGGAIFTAPGSNAQIENSSIRYNTGGYGAAVYTAGGLLYVQLSSVLGNDAFSDGGGFYLLDGTTMIHNTSIRQNTAKASGGGIYAANREFEVLGGDIMKNKAGLYGGGMFLIAGGDSRMYIGDTNMHLGNTASVSGTGVYIYRNENHTSIRMQHVLLTTSSDFVYFCCDGVRMNTTEYQYCNYPTCSSSQCIETSNNCDCPFNGPTDPNPAVPVLSSTNTTCTCTGKWTGTDKYCQIDVNECALNETICPANALCLNIVANYVCMCKPGYEGDGFNYCNDIDECNATRSDVPFCSEDATCTNTEGSFTCTCKPGYFGNGYSCQGCPIGFELVNGICADVNECLVNNGGCDGHVVCQNTNGSFICPPCPSGMSGNSSINCTRLCGNGICEAAIGENCVKCPQDCRNATCNECGDHFCDASIGETCSSCYEDCQSTCGPKKCVSACVHGSCNANTGSCDCLKSWTGPTCDVENGNIVIVTNNSIPTTILSPTGNQELSFSIGITRIQELDGDTVVQPAMDLVAGDRSYTWAGNLTYGGSNLVTMWKYSTVLANKAVINFTFYQFEETASIMFADKNYTFLPHTLKFSVNISSWPFKSASNTLGVVIESYGKGGSACKDGLATSGDDSHLQWVQISRNGVSLYGQFVDAAVVDGRNRNIKFRLNKTNSQVSAILPHFWDFAIFDPSYSVLVGGDPTISDDGCDAIEDNKSTSNKMLIGVVVGVVGGAIVIGAAIFVFLTLKKHRSMGIFRRANKKTYELN